MGMDVFGNNPTSTNGEYFRRNGWCWHAIAALVVDLCPTRSYQCKTWHSNDGDGLNAEDAAALASELEEKLEAGVIARFIAMRNSENELLQNEECQHCRGAGIRNDEYVRGTCNGCGGSGFVRPFITHYRCGLEDVAEFINFLRDSGGFKIF
jgi:hypothetical protein